MKRVHSLTSLLLCLLPGLALAAVGKVSVLEGRATRQSGAGAPLALQVGSEVELVVAYEGDTGSVEEVLTVPRSYLSSSLVHHGW